jgi:GT2 family glycosyltransferase
VLVDDSGDPHKNLSKYLKQFPKHKLVKHLKNMGFPISVNDGIKAASGEFYFVSNDDFDYTDPDWLGSSVRLAEREKEAGVIGWKLFLADGTIQTTGAIEGVGPIGRGASPSKYNKVEERDYTNGLIKKEVIDKIGYFDEGFTPGYYEDSDLCARARKAGFKVLYNPKCIIRHYKSSTISKIRDNSRFMYNLGKNKTRHMLLNYSIGEIWREWSSTFKKKSAINQKLKKESLSGTTNLIKVKSYLKVASTMLVNLPSILYLRMNRTKFLDQGENRQSVANERF